MAETIQERLKLLRTDMIGEGINAVILPSADPHQSEYTAAHWDVRTWFSGFTGSAGTLIVLPGQAALWTDARYFLQAEKELVDTGINLHRQTISHAPEHIPWLCGQLKSGDRIGIDGRCFSVRQTEYLQQVAGSHGLSIFFGYAPADKLWKSRPPLPDHPVFAHDTSWCSQSRKEKIEKVRITLGEEKLDYLVVAALENIAWVLNLRGSDIPCNPLFYAFLLIGNDSITLFADALKFSTPILNELAEDEVHFLPYEEAGPFLSRQQGIFAYQPDSLNASIYGCIPPGQAREMPDWIMSWKAVKSDVEIAHLRSTQRRDSIALLRAIRWLEAELALGHEVSEVKMAEKLAACRAADPAYRGESFPPIIGFEANGAIIHYRPEAGTAALIRPPGNLLLDSGGQYLDGTTDITRTLFLGDKPPAALMRHYTLVLKGFIALASARFPRGTLGIQLDVLARLPLWKEGLNYGHGTGHGVGFFLPVHEGPQGFATNPASGRGTAALIPGMVTTNEPGFYAEGAYGIRIENMLLCIATENGYLAFEDLTLFPVAKNTIDLSLMDSGERAWLDQYHQRVWEALSPLLEAEERAWLKDRCQPL